MYSTNNADTYRLTDSFAVLILATIRECTATNISNAANHTHTHTQVYIPYVLYIHSMYEYVYTYILFALCMSLSELVGVM